MKKILILTLGLWLVVLTGCSLFTKEDIVVDDSFDNIDVASWVVEDIEIHEEDVAVSTGDVDEDLQVMTWVIATELTWDETQWEDDVKQMIDKRQETIDTWWDLTEDDIALADDILDALLEGLAE